MMSDFVVSARKYRPATFRSVVGQEHITSTLRNAIERGQLAHAYLFCGPRGVGKTTCARIFAKAINCLHPQGAEACNDCESCRSFDEGRSMNIHELDAASNNSVEDIRTLIEQVRIVPQVGHYAVFIIDEVHMLSAAAFNAFLKTLEEPPAHAVFILATTEKHKIIPTILSRCQIYDFNRIRVEDAVGYLRHIASQEGVQADDESLNLIARKADGGMRDALSMFDKAVSFCGPALDYHAVAQTLNVLDYDTYFGVVDTLLSGNYVGALLAFDGVLARGFSGQTFLAGLNRHMRDLLVARNPVTLQLLEVAGTLSERYRTQAMLCTSDFLFGAMALLTETDGRLRQSSNQRLLVELTLMKLAAGQKKSEPAAGTDLPELNGSIASGQQSAQAVPTPEKTATEKPDAEQQNAENPAAERLPQPAVTTTPEASPAQTEAPHTVPSTLAPTVKPGRIGPSLADLQDLATARTANQSPAGATSEEALSGKEPISEVVQPDTREQSAPTESATLPPRSGSATPDPADSAAVSPKAAPTEPLGESSDAPQPACRTASRAALVSGASISALVQAATAEPEEESGEEATTETPGTDPESDRKLEAAREQILALIRQKRPRFVAAFERMSFRDGVIAVAVPSAALRDEILRSKTGMLMRIAELAGINGMLDLEIEVDETIRAARPIRLEDRMKFLLEKNPMLTELRKALDLEAE